MTVNKKFRGVPVTWTVTAPDDSVTLKETVTGADGLARFAVTLGSHGEAHTATATVSAKSNVQGPSHDALSVTLLVIADRNAPIPPGHTVTLEDLPETSPTDEFSLTISFSEPVTGFEKEDITVETVLKTGTGRATLKALTPTRGPAQVYTATIRLPADATGTVQLIIPAGVALGRTSGQAVPSATIAFDPIPFGPEALLGERSKRILPSKIAMDKVVFNEFRNAANDTNDWIELKNISEELVLLKEWEISQVTGRQDVDIVAFPDYTLPPGGILLIVNTEPGETDLIGGQDITASDANPDLLPQYLVAPEMKLLSRPHLLILRSVDDKNGTHEAVEDVVGNHFQSWVDFLTNIWPLVATPWNEAFLAAPLTEAGVWMRILEAEPSTTAKFPLRLGGVAEVQNLSEPFTAPYRGYLAMAWQVSRSGDGIGYDREVAKAAALGTPGYPRDAVTRNEGVSYGQAAPDTLVEFSDANLARKVREALRLPTETGVDILKIPKAELAKLIELDASHGGRGTSADRIINLTGLEHATQLRELRLNGNKIRDLAPLEGLTELRELRLSNNGIHYLAPLAQAKSLTTLHLDRNQIRDITPLETLTGLTTLDLENNQISDFTPLVQLSQSLEELDLQKNRIQDVTPLANLISLERLYLLQNPIANTFPLNALLKKNPKLIVDIRSYIVTEADGPTLAVSTPQPLTAGTLNGSVFTLTLSSGAFITSPFTIKKALTTSGVNGITFQRTDIKRVSHREITIELTFTGSIHKDSALTFTVGPEAIGYYKGPVLTAEIPVTVDVTTVSITPFSVVSPAIGEQLELALKITGRKAVVGYQATVRFDRTALRYVSSANGDYLPAGAFFVEPEVAGNLIKLNAVSLTGETRGDGTLATLTFEVIVAKASTLTLSDVLLTNSEGAALVPRVENAKITQREGDVNRDGIVNTQDLKFVVSNLGKTGANVADVNGDGVVNIQDLALVAGVLSTSAAAPSLHPQALAMFTAAEVRQWLSAAQHVVLTDPMSLRGVLFLQQLLTVLTPKETTLLPNFPNPFNPETWIPYQLAKASTVRILIYNARGIVVRRLELGYRHEGYYTSKNRAAYWDGKNEFGEPVASGVYFYTLTAGDFSATRKMLIRK